MNIQSIVFPTIRAQNFGRYQFKTIGVKTKFMASKIFMEEEMKANNALYALRRNPQQW